jgi:hypothetical protein
VVNASSTKEKVPPTEGKAVVKAYPKNLTFTLSLVNASLTQEVVAKSSSNKPPLPLSPVNVSLTQEKVLQLGKRGKQLQSLLPKTTTIIVSGQCIFDKKTRSTSNSWAPTTTPTKPILLELMKQSIAMQLGTPL